MNGDYFELKLLVKLPKFAKQTVILKMDRVFLTNMLIALKIKRNYLHWQWQTLTVNVPVPSL